MKIRLGVFFGGQSVEHEVSVITAIQAMASIDKEKYEIIPVYISKNGEMYVGDDVGKIESYTDIPLLIKKSSRVVLVRENGKVIIAAYPFRRFGNNQLSEIDIAFPMGHGTNVEDGALQGYFQTLGIPYVGCDVLSAAVGMNKYVMKTVLQYDGIPVLRGVRIRLSEYAKSEKAVIGRLEDEIGYPMIVKPINLGSSVGIKIGNDKETLTDAIEHALLFSNELLIERAIKNLKEVNVAVLGDPSDAIASECEEPISQCSDGTILSYDDKYKAGGKGSGGVKKSGMASLSRKIPADITSEQREKIRETAINAFRSLGCNGVARIDFMIDLDSGEIFFNEINTVPGSLSFYLWEPVGMKYKELLERMVSLAYKRDREIKNINFSFETNILQNAKLGGMKGK